MKDWGIKYNPGQIVLLAKQTGETARVRIEGVQAHTRAHGVIYDVREIDTAICYPAGQKELRAKP